MRAILLLICLSLCSCLGSSVGESMDSLQAINRLAAAFTGRETFHGSVDEGLAAVRAKAAEYESRGKAAYDAALANGASVTEAKKAAEEASHMGLQVLLGLVGTFGAGVIAYFRRNKTRMADTACTVEELLDSAGMLNETHRHKLHTAVQDERRLKRKIKERKKGVKK